MWHLLIVVGSLAILFAAGYVFLNNSLYKDFEDKDFAVQVCGMLQQHPGCIRPFESASHYLLAGPVLSSFCLVSEPCAAGPL